MVKRAGWWFGIIVSGVVGSLCAQEPGLPFLRYGVGAHAQSMGNAYLAQVHDASAVYWNPSALSSLESKEAFFYHSRSFADYNFNFFSYGQPLAGRRSAFGAAVTYFSKGTYDGRDEFGSRTGDFTASDSMAALAYSSKLGDKASAGASVKLIQSKIQSFSSTGFALDVSGSYRSSSRTKNSQGRKR